MDLGNNSGFTRDELNALGVIVSNAPISGKDAKFIAALMDKIAALLAQEEGQGG